MPTASWFDNFVTKCRIHKYLKFRYYELKISPRCLDCWLLSQLPLKLIPLSAFTRSRVWNIFFVGSSLLFENEVSICWVESVATRSREWKCCYRALTDVADYLQTISDKISEEVAEDFGEMSTSKKDYDHLFKVN